MNSLAILTMVVAHGIMLWLAVRFFRRDSDNAPRRLAWIGAANACLALFVLVRSVTEPREFAIATTSALLYAASSLLMLAARASHRGRPPDYIFGQDLPRGLVVWGPYRWVRHPFYLAYTLAWIAGVAMSGGHGIVAVGAAAMVAVLSSAAAREEAQFLASPFAEAYRGYQRVTGRLLPVWWR